MTEGKNGDMVSYPVLHVRSRFFQGYLKSGRIESSGMCDWNVRPHECSRQEVVWCRLNRQSKRSMLVRIQPPDLPDRNPGGCVYSAALPRACFLREEFCTTFVHKRIKGRRDIF